MTERELALLTEFRENIRRLIGLCDRIKMENSRLIEKNVGLQEQIDLLSQKGAALDKKNEEMEFAKSLLGLEDPSNAKAKISKIVREIDSCIALMSD